MWERWSTSDEPASNLSNPSLDGRAVLRNLAITAQGTKPSMGEHTMHVGNAVQKGNDDMCEWQDEETIANTPLC